MISDPNDPRAALANRALSQVPPRIVTIRFHREKRPDPFGLAFLFGDGGRAD